MDEDEKIIEEILEEEFYEEEEERDFLDWIRRCEELGDE